MLKEPDRPEESTNLSFFDEDDEPPRTTRTRVRPTPPPRRGRVLSGGSGGSQQVLVRRLVAVGVGVGTLLVLFLVVSACNTSRHKNALRDYNRQVSNIAVESRNNGSEFFRTMGQGGTLAPGDLYQQVVGYKTAADSSLAQAKKLNTPDEMRSAQQSLLIALELRRDALASIAAKVKTALGDQGDAADQAIAGIAAQMRGFDASDVLYDQRVLPFIDTALNDANVGRQTIEPSQFMKEISWVSPQYVAQKLGQQLSSTGDGGNRAEVTGPGLHGTGLNATSYGQVTLQPGGSNRLTYTPGQAFTVSFTNQGDNDEFNVKVSLKIAKESGGEPLTINKTVPRVIKGEKATVSLPLNKQPPLDTVVTITVTVAGVPGEKIKTNNTANYPSVFVEG